MRRAVLLILLGAPVAGGAQLPLMDPGTKVRIEVVETRKQVKGTVMSQTADTVTVADDVATAVASTSIMRIRRGMGTSHARGAIKGAKIGAVVVGGGFALLFIGAYVASSSPNKSGLAEWVGVALVGGGLEGALIGGVIGAAAGAEKWSTIYSNPSRVRISPAPGGATGLGLSFSF